MNYGPDCNSRNVIYLLSCKTCGIQYVGSTSRKFGWDSIITEVVLEHNLDTDNSNDREKDNLIYRHSTGLDITD